MGDEGRTQPKRLRDVVRSMGEETQRQGTDLDRQ